MCDCAGNFLEFFDKVGHEQVSSAEHHSFEQGLKGTVVDHCYGGVVVYQSLKNSLNQNPDLMSGFQRTVTQETVDRRTQILEQTLVRGGGEVSLQRIEG